MLSRTEPVAVRTGFGSTEFDGLGRYVEADFTDRYRRADRRQPVPAQGCRRHRRTRPSSRRRSASSTSSASISATRSTVEGSGRRWRLEYRPPRRTSRTGRATSSPGFLPHEREWVAGLLASGWSDVVRDLHPQAAGPYSWWSWRGKAFDNDAGWRIDYLLANAPMAARAGAAVVDRADAYDLRWSDHAPVTVTFG